MSWLLYIVVAVNIRVHASFKLWFNLGICPGVGLLCLWVITSPPVQDQDLGRLTKISRIQDTVLSQTRKETDSSTTFRFFKDSLDKGTSVACISQAI